MRSLPSTVGGRHHGPTLVDRESGTRLDPLIGSLVGGRYRIEGVLADGGMGRVYVATQESVGRSVALKVVRHDDDTTSEEEAQRRFRLEAAVLARLRHPNIVTLYDFGDLEGAFAGRSYFAMELLEGETLARRMETAVRLPLAEVIAITVQMVRALQFAHGLGVVHRDVKPSNVMLVPVGRDAERGEVKVLDFGTSKLLETEAPGWSRCRLTQQGFIVGTPEYMAPEQAAGRPCPASDMFSVGAIMFEALTGVLPYEAAHDLLRRTPSRRVQAVAPELDVPPEIEELIDRLLAPLASARPTSAEVLEDLRRFRRDVEVPPVPTPKLPRPSPWTTTRTILLLALLASGAALVVALAGLLGGAGPSSVERARMAAASSRVRSPDVARRELVSAMREKAPAAAPPHAVSVNHGPPAPLAAALAAAASASPSSSQPVPAPAKPEPAFSVFATEPQ